MPNIGLFKPFNGLFPSSIACWDVLMIAAKLGILTSIYSIRETLAGIDLFYRGFIFAAATFLLGSAILILLKLFKNGIDLLLKSENSSKKRKTMKGMNRKSEGLFVSKN
jgi:hypothetical protein